MYGNQYNIQRFLEMADIYFRLTGKTASTMSGVEMKEFYSCITQCSTPEELHKFIKNKINIGRDAVDTMENVHSGVWCMLPPAQRII
ncbi:MAG: hypothetical protein ACRESK_07795 [Gammaproteobacteria bacterium]